MCLREINLHISLNLTKDERQKKNEKFEKYRNEYMKRRLYLSKLVTRQFYKSMQMLQTNAKTKKDEPFEDYSIFLYRQSAPDFKDRIKDLEQKILYPVSQRWFDCFYYSIVKLLCSLMMLIR